MGCFQSKNKPPTNHDQPDSTTEKTYSWDKREKVNPADFTIENVDETEIGKMPGTINGQQFIVQNCKNSRIYLFDFVNTVTIDDCYNCTIFIGPTSGSLFIRDCTDCTIISSCGQFRTRDCHKMDVYLHCQTQPIIEASTKMRFSCFQAYYPELQAQFSKSGMSLYNNNWANIHDFTPVEGEKNWGKINQSTLQQCLPRSNPYTSVGLNFNKEDSVVPYTLGSPDYGAEEAALVLFFYDESTTQRINSFLASLQAANPDYKIQHTREIKLEVQDAQRIFGSDSFKNSVLKGPVVTFLFTGNGVQESCHKLSEDLNASSSLKPALYCIIAQQSSHQLDIFINFTSINLTI